MMDVMVRFREGVCDTPLHIYQCFVDGMGSFSSASICFSGVHFPVFLPKTVGAYRIRPNVSEVEWVGEAELRR